MELTEKHENINIQSVEVRVRERYKQLIEKGSCEIGVCPTIDPNVPPGWFDKSRFERSQQTAAKYLLSLKWASFSGLLLGIQIPLFLEPLLVNGNHESVPKLFRRYLDTSMKVTSWYEGDPFEKSSEAHKSLRLVRALHKSIFKSMNDLTHRAVGLNRLWVSQCQMVLTQAGFFGLLISNTSDCFAHGISDSELENIIYLWRVLGYLNGIQDEYNLCTGNLEETRVYLNYIAEQFVKPQISLVPSHPYPMGLQVAQGVANAFRPVLPLMRWQVFHAYWYSILEIPSKIKLTVFQWISLQLIRFTFHWILRFNFIYNLANRLSKRRDGWAKENSLAIEKQLQVKYVNKQFTPGSCPYKITLDALNYHKVNPYDEQLDANQNQISCNDLHEL